MNQAKSNVLELSVSEVSQSLKRMVEDNFSYVRIRGEISGFRGVHSSGHAYFSLKDEKARIDAVVWRGVMGKLRFKPEEGMEVIATGKLSTYPNSSRYQIIIEGLEPAGAGALMAMLEARKKKLAAEGLFDASRKKTLPFLPKVIGVITSPTGAVIRDIMHRINDRFPCHVIIWPVRVQGETSAAEVSAAIEGFNNLSDDNSQNPNNMPKPDLIIVARGGGSLEDLWGFNEEIVVRAVANCDIPLISAIGHETDTTLIDYVSDKRAPTPTAAAEIAVPVKRDLLYMVDDRGHRLKQAINRLNEWRVQKLISAKRGLPKLRDILMQPSQRLDHIILRLTGALKQGTAQKRTQYERLAGRLSPLPFKQNISNNQQNIAQLTTRLKRSFEHKLKQKKNDLSALSKLLNSLSYKGILNRGFALVVDDKGRSLKSISQAKPSKTIQIKLADGMFGAIVSGKPQKLDKKPKTNNKQGNLFGE